MLLQELEPFAAGYLGCQSDNVSRKIAAGMAAVCRYLPLSINPDARLAVIDRSSGSRINNLGVVYECGNGIVVRKNVLQDEMRAYPEFAQQLAEMERSFTPLATYAIVNTTYTPEERALTDNNTLWGGTWGGHANPDYQLLLTLGTDGLRKKIEKYRQVNPAAGEWYDASLLVLEGIDLLGRRFHRLALELADSDAANRSIYQKIAAALEVVPQRPAEDFMTACQLFALVFFFDGHDSPGAFDQYLGEYFEKSSRAEAVDILEGLWREFYRSRSWNLCIGGSDESWNDKSNALSYAVLDAAEKYGYNTPNLTMRVHRNTPEKLYRRAAQVISTGIGMPVLYNDEVVCPALEALGIPPRDAHLYAMNGCNQIDIQGKSHMGLEDGEICLLKCLEYALHDGKCLVTGQKVGLETGDAAAFRSFDELMQAYRTQVEHAVKLSTGLANKSQRVFSENAPNPLRSMLIEGCLEKGKDYKSGGPIYNHGQILTEGLADTIDSLAAIRHFVFETQQYTMAQVVAALAADYAGYDAMYRAFQRSPYHFGNGCEEVDQLGEEILRHYFTELMKYRTFRDPVNGVYGGGLSTFQRTGRYGGSCGASASGRKARSVIIADSIGAVPGMDKNGPTALLRSVLHFDQKLAKSGFVLNLKFDRKLLCSEKGQEGFLSLVKTYFANGGQQVSVNALSAEELQDARSHPENHRNLIVRVGGYSDYFVNLSDELKDNIIARTMLEV